MWLISVVILIIFITRCLCNFSYCCCLCCWFRILRLFLILLRCVSHLSMWLLVLLFWSIIPKSFRCLESFIIIVWSLTIMIIVRLFILVMISITNFTSLLFIIYLLWVAYDRIGFIIIIIFIFSTIFVIFAICLILRSLIFVIMFVLFFLFLFRL